MCPYCIKAKDLLSEKNLEYNELYIGDDFKIMEEMLKRSGGRRSVPQIFIGETHIGGYDDLYEIDRNGDLNKLLEGNL
jgi:glutaredoxin 3|tara:strand:- start:150 stop:383 length:234 start_codon:yes stop_codon:yes gene_type:complete